MTSDDRSAREAEWLRLTKDILPGMAKSDWPVDQDHCFQRICLDNACGGVWYDAFEGRPAYSHAPDEILDRAVALAKAIRDGAVDLREMNERSIRWRRELRRIKP